MHYAAYWSTGASLALLCKCCSCPRLQEFKEGWSIALHCYKGGILETGHVWLSLVHGDVIVAPVGLNPLRERDPDTFMQKVDCRMQV